MFDPLSQDYPGPLEPVEIAQQDDTQARTGNTTIPAGWKPIESAPKEGTPVLLFARHIDAEASTRVVGWFNADYGWIAQSYIGQPVARLIPSQWAELLPFPGSPASVAPGDAQDERSPTHGMTLGERIAHVGGRTNAQGYTEFGSPMAVNALIQHVLRDIDWTRQDDDGGYQARYRLPGGQWSSWGHVVCGVKGHEQELRYLPGVRRAAPAAGDARDAERYRWLRDQTETDGIAIVMKNKHFDESRSCAENIDKFIDAALAAQRKGDA